MWDNRKETYKLTKQLEQQRKDLLKKGMPEAKIAELEKSAWKDFYRRKYLEEGDFTVVPLTVMGEDGFEHKIDPVAMSYEEDFCSDPFEYGFDDPRLNKIWANADETDKKILRMLGDGRKQSEIARALNLSEKAISKRVAKYRN